MTPQIWILLFAVFFAMKLPAVLDGTAGTFIYICAIIDIFMIFWNLQKLM